MKTLDALVAEFQTIEAAVKSGHLTPEQAARLDQLPLELDAAQKHAAAVDRGADILKALGTPSGAGQKSGADTRLTPAAFKTAGKALAKQIQAKSTGAGLETKAVTLANYTQTVGASPVAMLPAIPTSFLEALPLAVFSDRHITWVQETARTLNVAVVAPGALKLESQIALDLKRDELKVLATTSGALDEYLLTDVRLLESVLNNELLGGLYRELERQVLYGTGTGELRGLSLTSGIQTVTAGASTLLRIRRALTSLEQLGYTPGIIAMNPTRWEEIETMTSTTGEFVASDSVVNAMERRLFGVRVAVTPVIGVNDVFVLDPSTLAVASDGNVKVDVGQPGDTFLRNQVVMRVESRYNVMVMNASGTVKVTLAAQA